jgi:hypothetical protein
MLLFTILSASDLEQENKKTVLKTKIINAFNGMRSDFENVF